MNKEIKYNGFTAVPSDYECADGDLDLALNLILEGGCVRPIQQPSKFMSLNPALGLRVIGIHKTSGCVNLIIVGSQTDACKTPVYYSDKEDSTHTLYPIESFDGKYLSYCSIGNTLVFATSQGLQYCLFKDGRYIILGERPPFVSISFGVAKAGTLSASDSYEYKDCPRWTGQHFAGTTGGNSVNYTKTDEDKAAMEAFSTHVMGLLLSNVAEKVTKEGMFYQPFFVRYAFRLYDETYAWHSAPILMLPDVCVPRVELSDVALNSGTLSFKSTLHVNYFNLTKKILADGLQDLSDWSDIISAIDIFISAPIYTYSQSEGVNGWALLSDIYARNDLGYGHRTTSSSDYAFIGHYSETETGTAKDITVKVSDYTNARGWNIALNDNFEESIKSCSLFYKISSVPIKDIKEDTQYSKLIPDIKDMTSMVTWPVLPDDYQSHFRLCPSFMTAYNSRLHLCGMNLRLPDPLPIRASVPATSAGVKTNVRVWSRRNGVKCCVLSSDHTDADYFPVSSEIPRWLWYPDSSAYMMMVSSGTKNIIVPLESHSMLNGAYWFAGLGADPVVVNADPDSVTLPDYAPASSKVYVSDATNPFLFPATGIVTVGSGSVFALASAVKALSQGQFGQFPLYAFSDEGVWSLMVSDTGSYSARQPVTRDVCTNVGSITQIDSAVLFATDRGIMLLSGSSSTCITEMIDSPDSFSLLNLPKGNTIKGLAGFSDDDIATIPFSQFLKDCGIVYDYLNQRIILFNPGKDYAYVYSMKSKLWGMMQSSLSSSVNAYPDAMAMDRSSNLVCFEKDELDGEVVKGLLVTRPLKLGEGDVLKTVDTVVQRGLFRKGHVKSILYGSRNLFDWHLISSSKGEFVRNIDGTPYKYFRVVALCEFPQSESISGCSVQYRPRFTNRPR